MSSFSNDQERLKYIYRERKEGGEFWDYRSWGVLEPAIHFQESQFRDYVIQYLREKFGSNEKLHQAKVLDVGAGWGRNLYMFHELGINAQHVEGVELLPHFVEQGRQIMPALSLKQSDAQKLPVQDASVDMILCHTVLSAILDVNIQNNILQECHRVLKPGGSILICDINDRYPIGKKHEQGKGDIIFIAPPGINNIVSRMKSMGFSKQKLRPLGFRPRVRTFVFYGFLHSILKHFGIQIFQVKDFSRRRWVAEIFAKCSFLASHFFLVMEKK